MEGKFLMVINAPPGDNATNHMTLVDFLFENMVAFTPYAADETHFVNLLGSGINALLHQLGL